jgi:F0F1-type ATP synthase epsilon subunit
MSLKAQDLVSNKLKSLPIIQGKTASVAVDQARHDYELDNIATKRDLRELELTLENKIKDVELKIEQSKAELVRWVIGAGFLLVALIAVLILCLTEKF